MKILVLSYQISPFRGSEYSVGWNYVWHASKHHELHVMYGASGDHMGDVVEMEEYVKSNELPGVTFYPVKPNAITRSLNLLNEKNIFAYSFYFAYQSWQRQVYQLARELCREHQFDLIHFVNPIGYREPGYLWKINLPYVWGPIGGTVNVPSALWPSLSGSGNYKLRFRAIVNKLQLVFNPRVKRALKHTDVLMTATSENQKNILSYFGKNSIVMPENAIPESWIPLNTPEMVAKNKLTAIWIGSVDERKALITLLKAMQGIKNPEKFELLVVGDGYLRKSLMQLAVDTRIDSCIQWIGNVKRDEVIKHIQSSDVLVITSVSEGNPTTVWEVMAQSVPVLTLDHCGMHDTISEKNGIKIALHQYEQVVTDLTVAINDLIEHPEKIVELKQSTRNELSQYTWISRMERLNSIYEEAIASWKEKK